MLGGSALRKKLSLEAGAPHSPTQSGLVASTKQGRSGKPPRKTGSLFVSEFTSSSEGDSQDENDDGIFGATVEQPTASVHREDNAILRDIANSRATSIETSKRPMSRPAGTPPPPRRTKTISTPDTPASIQQRLDEGRKRVEQIKKQRQEIAQKKESIHKEIDSMRANIMAKEAEAREATMADGLLEVQLIAKQADLDKEEKRYKVSQDALKKSNEQFNDRD